MADIYVPDDLRDTSQPDTDKNYFKIVIPDLNPGEVYPIQFRWQYEDKTYSDTNLHTINQGSALTFNGHTIWHGVMPVYSGIRKSLNIWLEPESFKIQSGEKEFVVKTQKSFL